MYKIIRKTKKQKESANLSDYEKTYKTFKWSSVSSALSRETSNALNAAYIAVDRHTQTARKNKVALYFESESGSKKKYTFTDLSNLSNQFANVTRWIPWLTLWVG